MSDEPTPMPTDAGAPKTREAWLRRQQLHEQLRDHLLGNLRSARPRLDECWDAHASGWAFADGLYRFYHQSFKAFDLQGHTEAIVALLAELAPDGRALDPWFVEIIAEGTGRTFSLDDNSRWTESTRPIVEAYLHARSMLELTRICAAELDAAPQVLPAPWAAVLYLYRLR